MERKHERRIGPFFFELQNLPAQPSTKNGAALRYIELRIKLIELCLRCLALKPTELWGVAATCSGKQLAFEAIRTANLTNIEERQTIKRQKKRCQRRSHHEMGGTVAPSTTPIATSIPHRAHQPLGRETTPRFPTNARKQILR